MKILTCACVRLLFGLMTTILLLGCTLPAHADTPPLAGKRVLLLGDSITQNGQYVSFMEYFLEKHYPHQKFDFISIGLASETVSGLSEKAHPFPRPYLHNRLQAALTAVKPQMVFACYGMNDGIYHPESVDRKAAFETGIRLLIAKVKAAGAQLILLTPPPFDPVPINGAVRTADAPDFSFMNPYDYYDDVLKDYAVWELTIPASDARVIDLHTPVSRYLDAKRKVYPNFQFSPDGIHPPPIGHLIIAKTILGSLGVSMLPVDLNTELKAVTADPLYQLVDAQRQERSTGWLPYVGYTRGETFKTDSVTTTEADVAYQQKDIDRLRLGLPLTSIKAATISWENPVAVTSVNQVDTNGVLVHAGHWGGPTVTVMVGGNRIDFVARTVTPTGLSEDVATASGEGVYTGGYLASTGNASFDSVLNSFAYDGPNPRAINLRGLIPGHRYEVQLFAIDDRDLVPLDHRPGTRTVRYGDRPDFSGSNSKQFLMRDNVSVIGRFTAVGPQVLIYQDQLNPVDHSGNVNAYVLRDVTKL